MPLKKLFRLKFIFLISCLMVFITIFNIYAAYLFIPGTLSHQKTIVIKKGLSIHKISKLLEQEGVIKYPRLFESIAKIYSLRRPLKSGEYSFTIGITAYQILLKLASGTSIIHKMLIPEGTLTFDILSKISDDNRLLGNMAANIPEGYLMPSTYFYSYGDQKEKIIDRMRTKMSDALDPVMQDLSPDSPLKTRKDVLILASIIEKEAGNDAEKPIISAVFINRLKKGIKLQADPTVAYAITNGLSRLNRPLLRSDLKIDSLYNTYKYKGLPPGPICCPGLASLRAAVSPAESEALYFVVNGQGGHNFAHTLSEHNANVAKYKAILRAKNLHNKDLP